MRANLFKPNPERKKEIASIIMEGDKKLTEYLANRLLIFSFYHTGAPKHGGVYREIFLIKKT
ncbi:hypothetical protein [Virgibacillus sp. DJP39]|uniref:hypothetical protein n=1 Tax=Virgibacillus sp. DJP39 TaxID=3409790 RepID=UPI003BB6BB7C